MMDMQELRRVTGERWDKVFLSDLPDQIMERLAALENEGMLIVCFNDSEKALEFVDDNSGEIVARLG